MPEISFAVPQLANRRSEELVARPAPMRAISADAVEFVRFCYGRRHVGWPELYDEMCAVASRGLFRGWGPDELAEQGIGFGLFEMPQLACVVTDVVNAQRELARIEKGAGAVHVTGVGPSPAPVPA
jgi:hypothetical protein